MTHGDGAFIHARQRLSERYGLPLGRIQYTRLCAELAITPNRRPVAVRGGREVVRVRIEGQRVYAVYDPDSQLIVTFIAPYHGRGGQDGAARRRLHRYTARRSGV